MALRNLLTNISRRDVNRGKSGFTLQFDEQGNLHDFTLNTTSAEVILAPPEEFGADATYPDILEGVIPDMKHPCPLPPDVVKLLELDSAIKSTKSLMEITNRLLWDMYKLMRSDHVRKENEDGKYHYGLSNEEIERYIQSWPTNSIACFAFSMGQTT